MCFLIKLALVAVATGRQRLNLLKLLSPFLLRRFNRPQENCLMSKAWNHCHRRSNPSSCNRPPQT